MKTIKTFFILACITLYASFTACSIDPQFDSRTGQVTAITLPEAQHVAAINWRRFTLSDIETATLRVHVMPREARNQAVRVSNLHPNIATVALNADGEVVLTGVSPGTDTIFVHSTDGSNITVRYQVVVTCHMVPVTGINVTAAAANMTLRIGRPFDLAAEITLVPENAWNRNLTFTSNDESIVTVTPEGEVNAVALGSTTITITALGGNNISRNVNVTVQDAVQIWNDFPRSDWTVTTTVGPLYAPLPFSFVPDGFTGPAGEQTHTQGQPSHLLNDDPLQFFSLMKLGRGAWNLANVNRAPQYQFAIPNQTVLPAFIVDMGEPKTFNYFKWRHRQWNWTAIWFGARMFGSNDGTTWTQIRSRDIDNGGTLPVGTALEAGASDILWIPNARGTWAGMTQYSLTAANNHTMRLVVEESTFQFVKVELASFSDIYGQPGEAYHPDFVGTAARDNATVNIAIFGLGYMYWD